MNEVLKAIFERRTCRAFTEQKVDKADLELLMKAGAAAPTAMNRQLFGFVTVTDSETIAKLADLVGGCLGREGYNFYKPAALVIPYTTADAKFGVDDNACAMQNIYLAAHSLGLGCVWINQLRDCCNDAAVREMLTGFGIPEDRVVYGIAAVGYRAVETPVMERKAPIAFAD